MADIHDAIPVLNRSGGIPKSGNERRQEATTFHVSAPIGEHRGDIPVSPGASLSPVNAEVASSFADRLALPAHNDGETRVAFPDTLMPLRDAVILSGTGGGLSLSLDLRQHYQRGASETTEVLRRRLKARGLVVDDITITTSGVRRA